MLRPTILAVAVGFSVGFAEAAEQSFPSDGGAIYFNMPSGNVGCQYTPAGGTDGYQPKDGGPELGCDRIEPTFLRFVLGKSGKAKVYKNSGDTGCCDGSHILRYGNSVHVGPFTCRSAKRGLTCSRNDGHGFIISKSKTSAY